ncbi:hypothetical protein AB4Z22_37625, partial [Paenibacillus sp. TAF58]
MKIVRNFPIAPRSVILRDQKSDELGAIKPTAKIAESSVTKMATGLNLAAEVKRKADSGNRLDGLQTSLLASDGSPKSEDRWIFRTSVKSAGLRQWEEGIQQRAGANERLETKSHGVLPSSSLASEIATKVVENSLKKIGPSLTVDAGQIGAQRSFSRDTELSGPSSVRAIWRQAENGLVGETGRNIEAVRGTNRERASENDGNSTSTGRVSSNR